jgi:biopolymer transport protein ExbD
MAINVGGTPAGSDDLVASINTTPLVDVMLVLLIIFLIAIPAANDAVPVRLPKERSAIRESKPEHIVITVDARGRAYWSNAPVDGTGPLLQRLQQVAAMAPQPQVHIRGDLAAQYDTVGRILQACRQAGIAQVGFITEPPAQE